MRICMILEGCYPYVRGGVSSWMHACITSMPEHEYVLWVIGAKSEDRGKFKYELPKNVVEVHEVFLDEALKLQADSHSKVHFAKAEIAELRKLMICEDPDWNILFKLYNKKKVSAVSFLMSEDFLTILLDVCKTLYPHVSFAEFFHAIRSMLLPTLYLMGQPVPKADVYHATSTGYGGLLGALGGWATNRPFVLTEHGIYTREREEEILRAKWVSPYFKQHWIDMFFMLAHCSYSRAIRVTSLFRRYSEIQVTLGCDPKKVKIIPNGIRVENFENIPQKTPDGYIDITAIVRIHPIKDIKTLIYAFFEVKSRVPNARLHILGDTDDEEYREECVDLIEQLNVQDITLEGNVNVVEFLKNTDFTVLSSI
ncbi:MAG: GT4 family glycosyltransferase PelF, partial [Clostridia bacterium]